MTQGFSDSFGRSLFFYYLFLLFILLLTLGPGAGSQLFTVSYGFYLLLSMWWLFLSFNFLVMLTTYFHFAELIKVYEIGRSCCDFMMVILDTIRNGRCNRPVTIGFWGSRSTSVTHTSSCPAPTFYSSIHMKAGPSILTVNKLCVLNLDD